MPITHCVLMKFVSGTGAEVKASIFERLQLLRQSGLGIVSMVNGPLIPNPAHPEISRGYTDGLVVTFATLEDRDKYNSDPTHQAIVETIVQNLEGGMDGLLRFDFSS